MLEIISSVSQLNTESLIAVYQESITASGREFFSNFSADAQLAKAEDDFLSYLRSDFFRASGAFYAVWLCDKTYCASLRMEPYKDGLLLEALETRPDLRRKGYAYRLMVAVLKYVVSLGYTRVYSHVNKRNAPSIRVHKKVGFQKISDAATYIDGTVTRHSYTFCYEVPK